MMLPVILGRDLDSSKPVEVNPETFDRHFHICGATGSGKTVAIHALLKPIMKEPVRKSAVFVVDPLGGLSQDLLLWMSSKQCPEYVRERLLYIDASNTDVVLPFNPLQFARGDDLYYHVARSIDLILRAWSSQDLGQMARLMQWSYSAATVLAELSLPLSLSEFILHPGTAEHKAVLRRMPDRLRSRWTSILKGGSEATRILESTRNRFDPIYSAPQTHRMFGVGQGRFDVERMIRERRIVIINVASKGKLTPMMGSTIGSLMLNEIFETAFRMSSTLGRESVDPTMVVLDEFQKFVGPDIEHAIPTVRQAGLQLVFAHQSFSQLLQGDLDLSSIIWQAQNRLMFANHHEDADIVAKELAVHRFDPNLIKEEIFQRKQRIAGHRIQWMKQEGWTRTSADSTVKQRSLGYSRNNSTGHQTGQNEFTINDGAGTSSGSTEGKTHADSNAKSGGRSEQLVPIYEEFSELSSRQYTSFDEQLIAWMKEVRQLETGQCYGKFVNDKVLHRMLIDYDPVAKDPAAMDRVAALLDKNFSQDFFISAAEADRQTEAARIELLNNEPIRLTPDAIQPPEPQPRIEPLNEDNSQPTGDDEGGDDGPSEDPFRQPRPKQ